MSVLCVQGLFTIFVKKMVELQSSDQDFKELTHSFQ